MIGESLRKRCARLFALRPHRASGTHGERQQLRRVARARRNVVEHLHAWPHLREGKELCGMARRVHAPILVRPDRTLDDILIALGGDARVFGRHRRAAAECEQKPRIAGARWRRWRDIVGSR